MSAGHAAARRYLRDQLRAGALQLPPTSPVVRAAMNLLDAANTAGQLQGCEHIAAQVDGGPLALMFLPMLGPGAWELRCEACFTRPPRSLGCQVCCRPLAPKVRPVVAVVEGQGLVLVGQLCADCRPGRLA